MKTKYTNLPSVQLAVALLGLLPLQMSLHAQESTAANTDTDEEVFELSPFVVDASQNEGYNASSTLAGTRIRTSLRDIGTSVQVITKDFMEDVGATNATELLVYTTNTEVAGAGGNFGGETDDSFGLTSAATRSNPQASQRIRGLFSADLTRNYYRTVIPYDAYNTNSVEINRGSNAILFGLGSPAGIINNNVEGALFNDRGFFQVRIDDFGSFRTSLNINKVIKEDVLSVRFAALKNDRKYYQEPAFEDTVRIYGAIQWRPTKTTTIRGNIERGVISANRPDIFSPMEAMTPWFMMGKPIVDTSLATGIGHPRDENGNFLPTGIKVDKNLDGVLDEVYPEDLTLDNFTQAQVFVQRPDGTFFGEGDWTWNLFEQRVGVPPLPTLPGSTKGQIIATPIFFQQGVVPFGDGGSRLPTANGYQGKIPETALAAGDALSMMGDGQNAYRHLMGVPPISAYYDNMRYPGFQNLDGFNWGKNMIAGSVADFNSDFTTYNVAIDQEILDDKAGIEVAYDYQDFYNDFFTPMQFRWFSSVSVDINKYLPNGMENPNFGRPFALARRGRNINYTELETTRVTGYFKHDFEETFEGRLGTLLGNHTLTGLYDHNKRFYSSHMLNQVFTDPQFREAIGAGTSYRNDFGEVYPVVYLGDSLLGSDIQSVEDVKLTPPTSADLWLDGRSIPMTFWDPGNDPVTEGQLITRDIPVKAVVQDGAFASETTVESLAAVWQGAFLKHHLITTIGYRSDTVDSYEWGNPPTDQNDVQLIDRPLSEWNFNSDGTRTDPYTRTREDRWSYGAVLHVPVKWTEWAGTELSFHYAESSNFQLQPGRISWDNVSIPNPSGETKEWGFSTSSFDNKLNVRVNWYETTMLHAPNPEKDTAFQLLWGANRWAVDAFNMAVNNEDDQRRRDFMYLIADEMVKALTPGELEVYGQREWKIDEATGLRSGFVFGAAQRGSETRDIASEGVEIEVTYNPKPYWRIHFNVARQETIVTNVAPYGRRLAEDREKWLNTVIPGFDTVTFGDLPARIQGSAWYVNPEEDALYRPNNPDGAYWSWTDRFDQFIFIPYRTIQAAEGTVSPEQREWRFNIVTNYNFQHEKLRGLSVGAAYRWEDKVSVGFPLIENEDGNLVGDIENPVFAPSQDYLDLWVGYRMPFFRKYGEWYINLRVRNVMASEKDTIPVALHGVLPPELEGVISQYSRTRLAPQREFILTSNFSW
ncbi:MAG: TonB-dependent receptor plug domain-containing protein [Puniceicoccaceae bacterium]